VGVVPLLARLRFLFADRATPVTPASLAAAPATGAVSLTWADGKEPDLAGYAVFRSAASGGPYKRLNVELLLARPAFTDRGAPAGVGIGARSSSVRPPRGRSCVTGEPGSADYTEGMSTVASEQHEDLVDALLGDVSSYNPDLDRDLLLRAFAFAERAHDGQLRKSGEEFIRHPWAVAMICAELRLDDP